MGLVLALLAVSGAVAAPSPAAANPIPSTAAQRAELAQWWAPVHFQDVDTSGDTSFGGESDYLTSYDFDGDLNGRNNWENASEHPLRAYMYYSVVQTRTFSYLLYVFFHPRDWADGSLDDSLEDVSEHENDTEAALMVVANDDTPHGTLKAVITVSHSDFHSWVPEGSDFTSGDETVEDSIGLMSSPHDDGHQRPWTGQQTGSHAAWAMGPDYTPSNELRAEYDNGDGILYYPGSTAEVPEGPDDRDVRYALTDIFAPGGMWANRNLTTLFATVTNFAGDDGDNPNGARCGSGTVFDVCHTDSASAPWALDDANDGPGKGYLATNPGELVHNYFNWPGKPDSADLEYTWNEYNGVTPPDPEDPASPDPAANGGAGDPTERHPGGDDGGAKPPTGAHHTCRPDGMPPTADLDTPYCLVYDSEGREWLGEGRPRRVIGYFNGGRTGSDGTPHYLVKNIPWSKVTHINYAFAHVQDNEISIGDTGDEDNPNPAVEQTWPGVAGAEMDPEPDYQGHFNLLTKYKKLHPRVKTLISVGGWAASGGFYTMTTDADGGVNEDGIKTFAGSVVDFLRTYDFDGVDIDYEYPTMLDDTGNPDDWDLARSRRPGLPDSYTALMKTLREKLDQAATEDNKYYLLTSASSASGYLVRGMANQQALRYQDFTNLMSYDFHGTWNDVVGPNAPLYDDGNDVELEELYETPEYDGIGYFNTDWAFHYLRGAMQAGRINIGIPYYTRGWRSVDGGESGLWGISTGTDCPPGTGQVRPCGNGAVGIDNIWHDKTADGEELGAGVSPMWHAKNLENNVMPRYADNVGLTPERDPSDEIQGQYARHWDDTTKTSWLWNDHKDVFLSTMDEQGLDAVADYVIDKGAGGVMMWELGGDYECPESVTGLNPCRMGYTMTTKLHERMGEAGPYGASRNTGSSVTMPSAAIDVTVELVEYGSTVTDLWPMQPTVRVTNNTDVTIGGGKDVELRFDLPTSTPPLIKDANWQTGAQGGKWRVEAGHTGPNAGDGLSGDFHRVGVTLDYCQIIPPGRSIDIPIIYYLPATGPVNTTLRVGTERFALHSEHNRGASLTPPPAGGCPAPTWDTNKIYDPATQPVEEITVKYGGSVWQAKWWTQGNIPGTGPDADHEPWRLIGPAS
ncbi:glycosyl hydrolase family 18 protein [Plantactinospora sonchi]|uniref:Glycosyl hydrolase family 18 protein n=1 Tax=Plantactinospora sonchi TaxID=1544735 RepID=A0ABU7S596_9ACTN